MDIRESYDAAAAAYAEHLFTELERKPLDRHLLNRFAEAVAELGMVADLGCGPGHIAKYLHERGVTVCGVDLSPGMITCARTLCPGIEFRVGDMTKLDFANESLAGIVAFYSIVHLDAVELLVVMREFRRVLRPGGLLLVAFHIGNEVSHVDDLWGCTVSLDFRFHLPASVIRTLNAAEFSAAEMTEREPYEGAEFPSRRCYLLAQAL